MATRSSTMERSFKRLAENYVPIAEAPTFTAAGVYDKLAALVFLVVVCGVAGVFLPPAIGFAGAAVGLGVVITSYFRPMWSKVLAPVYAVAEGLALGVVSRVYSSYGGGIVPLAVLFTGGVFLACLLAYRTGLVKVTPRWASVAMVGCVGLITVSVASLIGLQIPGLSDVHSPISLIFGIVALGIGVISLFVDFSYVEQSERMGLAVEGEWLAAFAMLTAIVLVYVEMLRILAFLIGRR